MKIHKKLSHLYYYSDPLLSTLLKWLWQRIEPRVLLGMMLQACHTRIWEVSPILLCRSSQILSGWIRSVAGQLLSHLSRGVRSVSSTGLWLGHSRIFRDLSRSHSCVVLAVCLGLLSCWKLSHCLSLRP
jgi:hypothetical protein